MKKLFSLLLIIILMYSFNVFALEDKLLIRSDGDKLTYDKELIHTNDFIVRDNMLPGESYDDALTIENKSTKTFSLYFKLDQKSNVDLLNYLNIVVKIDGTTVYSGKITEAQNTSNPNKAILLKKFIPNQSSYMTVKTTLSEDYTKHNNTTNSEIDLKFYAMYGDPGDNPSPGGSGGGTGGNPSTPSNPSNDPNVQEIVPIPHTGIGDAAKVMSFSSILIILGITILIVEYKLFKGKKGENK